MVSSTKEDWGPNSEVMEGVFKLGLEWKGLVHMGANGKANKWGGLLYFLLRKEIMSRK